LALGLLWLASEFPYGKTDFGGFVKALTILLLSIFALVTTGCGKDDGVAATFHEKAKPTPPTVEQKAIDLLSASGNGGSGFASAAQSPSSAAIRANLLGASIQLSPKDNGDTRMDILLSYRYGSDINNCQTAIYNKEFSNGDSDSWMAIKDLGHAICLDKTCSYLMVVIEQSPFQFSTGKEQVEAAVPLIFEDRMKNKDVSSADFRATSSESSYFMAFQDETVITCKDPIDTKTFVGPVLPEEYNPTPDYSYYDNDIDYSVFY
jgi:hypothetical protein